jgi:hypothetical protein
MKTREKVREDLMTHLQKAGFTTQTLEVDVMKVTFEKNVAHASVSFRPRGATNIHDSMVMNYTMEIRDGHWMVIGRSDSSGHGTGQAMAGAGQAGALPAGHPQVSAQGGMGVPAAGAPPQFDLPPGHPALESMPPASSAAQPLPPGHPNVAKPAQSAAPSGTPQSSLTPNYRLGSSNHLVLGAAFPAALPTGLAA